jgi:hypothetical protein
MSRRAYVRVAAAAAAIILALTPSERPVSAAVQADLPVPFKVGEVLTYDVSWSSYVTAGTATLSVKERRPAGGGVFAYDFVAEGKPTSLLDKLYHVYYKAESLLGTRTFQPSVATMFSDERGRQKLRTTRFVSPTTIEVEPKAGAPKEKHTVPKLTLDPLSAIYVIRAVPVKAGQVISMPVVDNGDIYTVRWQVAGPENVTTPMGAISAWRLLPGLTDDKGRAVSKYKMTLWLSADTRRLPLKFQAGLPVGSFTLTLSKIAP